MNRTAYACLVFNTKTRRVEGWSTYSEPGDLITCMGNRVFATLTSAEGVDFEDARDKVIEAMRLLMPDIPPDERIVAVDAAHEAKLVDQAMAVSSQISWMLGLLRATADEDRADNFASITIGGVKAPWDRATLTLHRPGGVSPEEAVLQLQKTVAERDHTIAALEARIVELSETDPGR
jgi:hypothetical protein